jgi:hypothetical protein
MTRSGSGISAIFANRSFSPSAFVLFARFGFKLPGPFLHRHLFSIAEGFVLFGAILTLAHVNLLGALSKNNFPFSRLAQSSRLRQSAPGDFQTIT